MSLRAWAELLRVSALFTVPGDALAGAASAGVRPNRGTALAVGASLCLYEAGMALNDWADRDEDAVERPHRPIPSGRITPNAALAAAGGLTATGLLLASRAGRPALALSTALAATVWAYDLRLKHTAAGPVAMGAARTLDVLLGATATRAASPHGSKTGPVAGAATSSPARRGVLARLSVWAGPGRTPLDGPANGLTGSVSRPPSDASASTARFSSPVAPGVLSGLSAWASGPVPGAATSSPARRGVLARLSAWAGEPTDGTGRSAVQGLASRLTGSTVRPATEAGASTARLSPSGRSKAGSGRTPVVRRPDGPAPRGRTAVRAGGPVELLASKSAVPAAGSGVWQAATASLDAVLAAAATAAAVTGAGPAAGHHAVPRAALVPAALLGAHTVAVTTVSRREVYGGSVGAPLAALAVTGVLGAVVGLSRTDTGPPGLVTPALAAAFVVTAGQAFLHAALNPSPQLTQRAVGGGIRAMIPFQAALAARGGAPGIGLVVMGLVPLARKLAKRVSVT
ncbi:prenyltransferase [Streptomyces sp. S4.7]|uniref:UbiA family prenyltransferase n=1 Tax=Streptomyces sp. S4.7 TaxID=2705439 RepID=UPI001398DF83|nr:UbiA family prenyltransferase [Streptomyces sp. S4.7]QHY99332.1 prenyltransferase [Streptomyces sp. S4.7]